MARSFGHASRSRLLETDDDDQEIHMYVQNVVKQLHSINRNHHILLTHEEYFSNCSANPDLGFIMNLAGDAHSLSELVKSLRDAVAGLQKLVTRQTGHGHWID